MEENNPYLQSPQKEESGVLSNQWFTNPASKYLQMFPLILAVLHRDYIVPSKDFYIVYPEAPLPNTHEAPSEGRLQQNPGMPESGPLTDCGLRSESRATRP